MKFFKDALKYVGFFVLGVITSSLVVSTALSYYTVQELTKALGPAPQPKKNMPVVNASILSVPEDEEKEKPANPNLKDILQIGSSYVTELDLFDHLTAEIAKKKRPDICTTLCNPINMDRSRVANERSAYLAKYYQQEGARALQDPLFRLKLHEVGLISQAFPPTLRSVLKQVESVKDLAPSEQPHFAMTMNLQTAAIQEVVNFYFHWEDMKHSTENLKTLRSLVKSCQQGVPRKKIQEECLALSLVKN